jgi:hypothetical protein
LIIDEGDLVRKTVAIANATRSLIAVCAGAPLVALGIGAPSAWADASASPDDTSSSQATTNGGLAVSVSGNTVVQFGNSTATTTGSGIAVAFNNSTAEASGTGNFAFAANNSTARAIGTENRAVAAHSSFALAGLFVGPGDYNTATAVDRSNAIAAAGNFNRATALHSGRADAGLGNHNTATAINSSSARAASNRFPALSDNNTATAINDSDAGATVVERRWQPVAKPSSTTALVGDLNNRQRRARAGRERRLAYANQPIVPPDDEVRMAIALILLNG